MVDLAARDYENLRNAGSVIDFERTILTYEGKRGWLRGEPWTFALNSRLSLPVARVWLEGCLRQSFQTVRFPAHKSASRLILWCNTKSFFFSFSCHCVSLLFSFSLPLSSPFPVSLYRFSNFTIVLDFLESIFQYLFLYISHIKPLFLSPLYYLLTRW